MAAESVLIAYFSHSGTTQVVAEQIHQIAGGDMFRIKAVEPYPRDYDAVVEVARKEQRANARPKLAARVANVGTYSFVFLGYPDWWSTMPMPVFTFLETYDFSTKKIAPFCTHGGSGLGRSVQDIERLCPRSNVLEGLAISDGQEPSARKAVAAWIGRLGLEGRGAPST